MKLTETQLDKLKDNFIDRFIADMDVDQLRQYVRDDLNTYLANCSQEKVIGEMHGHLCDDELVDSLVKNAAWQMDWGKTMKVKAGEFIKKDSGEVIWGSEAFIDEVFKALYGNEYEYEIWSYNDALQKIKNLVQQMEDN